MCFLRRSGRLRLLVGGADADLFQERLNRLFAAEKFLDRNGDVAGIADFVNFVAQFQSRLFVEITVFRFFKNGRHVGGDRISPGIAVVTGIVTVHVAEVSHHRRARIDREKNFFQNRICDRNAIVGRVLRMLVVHREIE